MKLQDAFRLLTPAAPTYQALRQAKADFLQQHPDPVLQAICQDAYSKLVECDVYWFCDYSRHLQNLPDIPLIQQIQTILTTLADLSLPITRSGMKFVVTDADGHESALTDAGFKLHKKTGEWSWQP